MAFFEAFPYYPATITAIREESANSKTFTLDVKVPWTFKAGQHCVIRLTDEADYRAARDYSISSAPSSNVIEITVGRAKGGEVSGWLHDRTKIGDKVEISKQLGDDFTWNPGDTRPLLLIAGGIGVAPLMSMLREHRLQGHASPITLAYSARTWDDTCFKDELTAQRPGETIHLRLTRQASKRPGTEAGRINSESLEPLLDDDQAIFICGPTSFADAMESLLHDELGVSAERILTERFG